ncbi:hypothetical protein BN133_4002 [Cronobacter dublinensis 582]|nr:hypothetical protein BN133_4002 [Cronobacter dublinensis 582]
MACQDQRLTALSAHNAQPLQSGDTTPLFCYPRFYARFLLMRLIACLFSHGFTGRKYATPRIYINQTNE